MMIAESETEPDFGGRVYRMPSGSERRRGLRVRQERPVKIYAPNACRFIAGWTQDVSVTGLRITLPASAPVRPGSTLAIHVGLNSAGEPLINRREMMPAKVVWVESETIESQPVINAGVEFTASIAAHLDAA
jgi:hypothetical protein